MYENAENFSGCQKLQQCIHFFPGGDGGLGALAGDGNGCRRVGKANGVIYGHFLGEGDCQRTVEGVSGGGGVYGCHLLGGVTYAAAFPAQKRAL